MHPTSLLYAVNLSLYPVNLSLYPVNLSLYPVNLSLYQVELNDQSNSDQNLNVVERDMQIFFLWGVICYRY